MTEGNELFKPLPETQEELAQHLGQCAAAAPKVLSAKGKAEGNSTSKVHPWSPEEVLAAEAKRGRVYGTLSDGSSEVQINLRDLY